MTTTKTKRSPHARKLFTRIGADGYGPKKVNPIYEVRGADGCVYDVKRHHWTLPTNSWGWRAKARGVLVTSLTPVIYEDTLGDIAYKLKIIPDGEEWHDMVR